MRLPKLMWHNMKESKKELNIFDYQILYIDQSLTYALCMKVSYKDDTYKMIQYPSHQNEKSIQSFPIILNK